MDLTDSRCGTLAGVTDFQALLDAAAVDPRSPAWDKIWAQSCHQGTCDPASAVLLPWLARTCAALPAEDREKALALAGFIAVDAEANSRTLYADDIAILRALALDSMATGTTSDEMFVYILQAVLGFEGDETWGKELDHLNDGEVDVQCPACDEELLIELESQDSPVEPGLPSPLAARLHTMAVQAGRESVATGITYLFGRVTCASCEATFPLADHLAGHAL
ncbi:hypothetical protein O7600_26790 [Micromonospora sp. WMMA1998]|uniref:hypothetical protein n=1 Tax=Micromonospora sp. WMMA1998 TaxID=3015167 RepID=UPI00248C8643|nr:hypothetical protein [Micromonospora sp. WMMA1998]WBC14660.1 hypothetical protein O7600_26790 [Micromonospora sp. WMMA1998]